MADEWILDVLADLKRFARMNGMFTLAEQLDDTAMVAARELAQIQCEMSPRMGANAEKTGGISRGN